MHEQQQQQMDQFMNAMPSQAANITMSSSSTRNPMQQNVQAMASPDEVSPVSYEFVAGVFYAAKKCC